MNPFALIALIAIGSVVLGAGLIFASVRRAGWYRRVVSWLGVAAGVLALGFGALAGVVAVTVGPDGAGPGRPTAEELARPAEGLAYRLVAHDSERRIEEHRGDVVLLNLWATWCVPCVAELPYLNRLQEEYGDRGLVVITLSNEGRDLLRAFGDRHPRTTVDAYVPGSDAAPDPFRRAFRVLPTTYVIDRDGFIREYFAGSRTYDQFAAMVRPHL
jgi:thiol-disulfide isomerase/thioredoxin